MNYEYLYIYREENTVIQLYRESENVFVFSDGVEYIELDLSDERNKEARECLKNGHSNALIFDTDGYEYEVYTSANAAFGV